MVEHVLTVPTNAGNVNVCVVVFTNSPVHVPCIGILKGGATPSKPHINIILNYF